MTNEELKAHIQQVHQQLEDAKVQTEDKNLIGHLMSEIVERASADKEPDTTKKPLKERLEEQEARFENTHPLLAATLRQIINALNNMGI
ncbi:MAG: DUF4404 family protein [bacterium]